ncbi:NADPH-dependent FMN reductase [Lysinibacter cavernae]|uniref:NAD(P)H-dependent FMN reductase n=1 Tax=Lysinibacter cavernae TaxID=1640652 RepID=A0A7X5TU15_9MICO|nr:NAD(P)H-dependent oxidoreductase [Lysinibacter cavernae]NIH53167.1 NAD(P)H-dependent FMN reductase [Lysinibacter cavernae]
MDTPLLQVIIGSTRPGRVGASVADWFADAARADGQFAIEVVDLAEVGLPLLDEPHHPRLQQYTKEHTKRWSETIRRGDAFVFVIPEYNYSLNAATKNAIDFLFHEWSNKALGIVSYGGISGGLRSAQVLKQVASSVRLIAGPDTVIIPWVATLRDEQGVFHPTDHIVRATTTLLADLRSLTDALASRRSANEPAD